MACSNNGKQEEATSNHEHKNIDTASTALRLNNGVKWKTDEATRKNVAHLTKIINDNSNIDVKNRAQLTKQLQTRIDTLVMQCKMQGPDHDALHVWLNQVLHNLKEMKEEEKDTYLESYAELRKDVENFHVFFE